MPNRSTRALRDSLRFAVPLLGAFLAIPTITAVASAQHAADVGPNNGKPNGPSGARMRAALFEGISLTGTEQKAIDSVWASYQPQVDSLRNQGPNGRRPLRDLHQREFADLRAILSPDQQGTFDTNVQAMRARMENGRGGGPGAPAGGPPQ
jgi:hypothetical protein